jgi:RNA polymerase sigma-70 factor (ECF subfamily)
MHQHWSRVVAVLYRLLGDDAEAQDLALEAFWRLHRRGPLVNPAGAGSSGTESGAWLNRVAVNLGLNALRARQRRRRYESQAGLQALEQDAPADPAFTLEQAEERQRVRAALAKMKPRSASLLVLRHSGFSYAEIAAALGVAVSSVGSFLARAEAEFERRYINM